MTEVTLAPGAATVATSLPYRPGPVSRFLGWMESPGWRASAVLVVVSTLLVGWAHLVLWSTGVFPVGTPHVSAIILAFYVPFSLGVIAIGRRIARTALAAFWPATGWPDD